MPRLFVPPEGLTAERLVLEGEAHHHLVKVLRLAAGDEVTLFDGRGRELDARVVAVGTRAVELAPVGAPRTVALAAAHITLLVGLPRGERMDLIVQKTTELGVARIVPVLATRSVPRPPPATRGRRWRTIAREAARQSGRADVPEVDEPVDLVEALAVAAAPGAAGGRYLLWEEERGRSLRRTLAEEGGGPVALLVGPEGGWTTAEVAQARAGGFSPVGLGPRILRVETAAIVAVALVQAAGGGLD